METRERIFEFDTTAGVDNLKKLRAEIKELKTALEELEIGSQEYEETSDKLFNKQSRLSELMKEQKRPIEDVAGSFNNLNAQLRDLKEAWKATGDELERAALTVQINEVKGQMNAMNESIGNYQHNVGNYTNSIIEAFQKMGISVTSLTAPLKKMGVDIESMDTGIKIISETIKTFSGQNLAMLQKMFLTLATSTKAFIAGLNGIKAAIAATGIGALIVAIGILIAQWDDWFGVTEAERRALENTKIAIRDLNDELSDQEMLLSYHLEMKKLQGASELEVLQYENEELQKLKDLALAKYDEITANISLITSEAELKEARKAQSEAMDKATAISSRIQQNYLNQSLAIERAKKKAADDAAAAAKKRAEEEKKAFEDAEKAAVAAAEEEMKKLDEALEIQKNASEELKSDKQKEIDAYNEQKKKLEEWNLSTEDLTAAHNKKMKEFRQQEAEDVKAKALEMLEFEEEMRQKKNETDGTGRNESDWDYDAIVERNNAEFDAAKALNDSKIALNKELMLSYDETSEEYQRLMRENEALAADTALKQAQRDKANSDAYDKLMKKRADATKSMVTTTSNFLKQAAQVMGENTKAAKGFAVASATIDTIAAAIAGFRAGYNQWKDAPGPLAALAPIQGAINAAAALAAGYAEVQKILSVDTTGNSASGGSAATAMALPNIEGLNSPMDYTRQVTTETEKEEMNSPQRVYILESDIQESGNRVRVREEETTF